MTNTQKQLDEVIMGKSAIKRTFPSMVSMHEHLDAIPIRMEDDPELGSDHTHNRQWIFNAQVRVALRRGVRARKYSYFFQYDHFTPESDRQIYEMMMENPSNSGSLEEVAYKLGKDVTWCLASFIRASIPEWYPNVRI